MNATYCESKLIQAQQAAQSPNPRERAIGQALEDYWQLRLRQYQAARPVELVELIEPEDLQDLPAAGKSRGES